MSDADGAPYEGGWNPHEALQRLTMERALESTSTLQVLAKRLFEENLSIAVMSICHIATYGDSEAMRFNASKYVVERTMGPAVVINGIEGRHAWEDIYDKVVSEAEGYLNK